MQAVLLATSELNKLTPLTQNIPDVMLPLVNRPVMAYTIEHLARQGITHILVCLHEHASMIETYFGTGSRWGVQLEYVLQSQPMGSAGSLKWAQNRLEETLIVIQADTYNEIDFQALRECHQLENALVTVAVGECATDRLHPIRVDALNKLVEYDQAGDTLYSSGVYILQKQALNILPDEAPLDIFEHLLPALMDAGAPIGVFLQENYWNPLDNFYQYQEAQQAILASLVRRTAVPGETLFLKAAQVEPGIWVGLNTVVHPSARLLSPVFIGSDCRVGEQVELGPDVVLGKAVYIDDGGTIQNSTIFDHSYVGRLVDVKNRVVDRNMLIDTESGESIRLQDPLLLGEIDSPLFKRSAQRAMDILLSLFLLLAMLPVMTVIGLLLRGTTGKLFETSTRVTAAPASHSAKETRADLTFSLLRFNTRLSNGMPSTIGNWVERWELNRLPELLNVLRGEMALVGVMPLTVEQAQHTLEDWQILRYEVQPGFTGLWYLQAQPDYDFDQVLVADTYYVATRSWKYGLYLLWKTPKTWYRRGMMDWKKQEWTEEGRPWTGAKESLEK